jgi:DnaJ-class molecular chaperone
MKSLSIFTLIISGRVRTGPRKGKDVQANLSLSFLEAVNGCEKEIDVEYAKVTSTGSKYVLK